MKIILLFFMVLLSDCAVSKSKPTLIGGDEAKPGDFPEVLYITSGRSRCSATLISENVILTAAHCISDGGDIAPAAEFVVNQQVFQANCTHHPMYESEYSYDFALCKTTSPVKVKPASIGTTGPQIDKNVVLMGYGCVNPRDGQGGGGNGWDGKLRWGKAKVTKLPSPNGVGGGQYYYTNDNSALCFGDSGGPSMVDMENPKQENHIVIGVNSRGNIMNLSLLSSTYLDGFRKWAAEYADENQVAICGINKDCIKEKPEPEPKPKCKRQQRKVKYYKRKLEKWENRLEQCQAG